MVDTFYWLGSTAAQAFAALVALTAVFGIFRLQAIRTYGESLTNARQDTSFCIKWNYHGGRPRGDTLDPTWHWERLDLAGCNIDLEKLRTDDRMRACYEAILKWRHFVYPLHKTKKVVVKSLRGSFVLATIGIVGGLLVTSCAHSLAAWKIPVWTVTTAMAVLVIGILALGWRVAEYEGNHKGYHWLNNTAELIDQSS